MDSFFSLFDPNEGQGQTTRKVKCDNVDPLKKSGDAPKGRRRGRRANGKNETLPEESSFLCDPELSTEVLVKNGSYFDSYFEVNDCQDNVTKQEQEARPKRRNSNRKCRRRKSKTSPLKEISPWTSLETLNNATNAKKVAKDAKDAVGRNVNNLKEDVTKRKEIEMTVEEKQVNKVIEQLEKVNVKEYTYDDDDDDHIDDDCGTDDEDDDVLQDSSWSEEERRPRLPPEPRFGNVEYKLHLVAPQEKRLQHLVTQLKWRLRSGGGVAIYVIGVRDCGTLKGLPPKALRASLRTLRAMAGALRASVTHVTARRVTPHRAVAEIYIRKLPEAQQCELRIAVVGAHGAGKSTLIGVLTQGELDNGRGSARLNMFRHLHEVRSGSTSSLSHEILGFDDKGNVVNYGCSELMTAERIGERSAKLVSFLDLAGHSKYQRTTVAGLTGYRPHHAMLLVSATAGVTSVTQEHLELIKALEVPFFTVVTKCDLAPPPDLAEQKPTVIKDEEAARSCVAPKKLILDCINGNQPEDVDDEQPSNPVFHVSSVSGRGLRALHAYLLALPTPNCSEPRTQEPCEFQIDEIFHVGDNGGPVVGGLMAQGELYEGDDLLIGPLDTGEFVRIKVLSIYRNKVPCGSVVAGQSASLGLGSKPQGLRAGMVLLPLPKGGSEGRPVFRSGVSGPCRCLRQVNITRRKRWDCKRNNNINQSEDVNQFNQSVSDSDGDKERCRCYDDLKLDDAENPRGCVYFQANIQLLKHTTESISPGFQCTVHIGNVRQTAIIEGIFSASNTLQVGSTSSVLFRFARRAEFLRPGRRLLCRSGGTTAVGDVCQVFPA